MPNNYHNWRRAHLVASYVLGLIALVHIALTWQLYEWSPDAVWFLGTGMAMLLLAALNLTHVGVEPCHMPTTKLIRISNWIFFGFGIAAAWAVSEPQAYAIVVSLAVQAIAAHTTLPGPTSELASGA